VRAFTAAAVQVAPHPGPLTAASVKANLAACVDLADRNLAMVERHLDDLRRPARTSFPHPPPER
jgi:deaminated glutathione amidase